MLQTYNMQRDRLIESAYTCFIEGWTHTSHIVWNGFNGPYIYIHEGCLRTAVDGWVDYVI